MTRRTLLKILAAAPAAPLFPVYGALAAPYAGKLKITAIKTLGLQRAMATGNCLIKVETDAGLYGIGEAGATAAMARARIETMAPLLIGKDPLSIEKHFFEMTSLMHTYIAHIPTISGIDIALWDLAGKVLDRPVFELLGGPFREAIPMYSHGDGFNMLDMEACRAWAAMVKSRPEGFKAYKNSIHTVIGVPPARYVNTLTHDELKKIRTAYTNCREAVGDEIDIAVHCHNEFDTLSAINVAKAVEPMDPLFIEDALNPPYSEAWMALKRSTHIPLLTGEKLELVRGFKPFLDAQAVDIVHPDLAFAGGLSGTRKIADYAALTRTPVALHNVGTLVLTHASAHFAASIQNFYRSESALGRPTHYVEQMAASNPPVVRESLLPVPKGAGLGLDLNTDFMKQHMAEGETWWG
ncbi:MAG: mandelate racemase/muconate lactonizing enzyme family protein [Bryobacteraceae bacterium]